MTIETRIFPEFLNYGLTKNRQVVDPETETNEFKPVFEEGFVDCKIILIPDDDLSQIFTYENLLNSSDKLNLIYWLNGEEHPDYGPGDYFTSKNCKLRVSFDQNYLKFSLDEVVWSSLTPEDYNFLYAIVVFVGDFRPEESYFVMHFTLDTEINSESVPFKLKMNTNGEIKINFLGVPA